MASNREPVMSKPMIAAAVMVSLAIVVAIVLTAQERDRRPEHHDVDHVAALERTDDDADRPSTQITIVTDDQLRFDPDRFTVAPGERVALTLDHEGQMGVEMMGHNVVILKADEDPGAFGEQVQAEGGSLDNEYVPESMRDRVVAFTAMLGGGDSDTIEFEAPSEPGEHPFICSFPGHYAAMQGVMEVRERDDEAPQVAVAEEATEGVVRMVRTEVLPEANDPHDPLWDDAPVAMIEVQRQNMIPPMLAESTVEGARVQAMRTDDVLMWRVSWESSEAADVVQAARFSDALAVQVPLAEGASFMMGSPGRPVHVAYWRAAWQRDVDDGFTDLATLHPNFWTDLYWFADADYPYRVNEAFTSPAALRWNPGAYLNNPMSQWNRAVPVEEIVAEGPGSITSLSDAYAEASGRWADGQWVVVIRVPVHRPGLVEALSTEGPESMAIAVWDGSAGNVGGRKHYTTWVPVEIEP